MRKSILKTMIVFACFWPTITICAQISKFEPENGKCFVFIGQDLGSVGGTKGYEQGYSNSFQTPAGVTVYLGLNGGKLDGLYNLQHGPAGDACANRYATAPSYSNSMIAIGLWIVGMEEKIVGGKTDHNLQQLGEWLKVIAPRPVFLRIGYEFDGFDWNHYVPETYIPAFRYVKDYLDKMGVDNVAYVWQSKGFGLPLEDHEKWYPGDEYVDWCGYSHFNNAGVEMIQFARSKGKPVFIAESTPVFYQDGNYLDADIKKPETAYKIWNEWFNGFFRTIEANPDVVKAFSYINADWSSQPMWMKDEVFMRSDARIQMSDYVRSRWAKKMSGKRYVNAKDLDWDKIYNNKSNK